MVFGYIHRMHSQVVDMCGSDASKQPKVDAYIITTPACITAADSQVVDTCGCDAGEHLHKLRAH
jgi:hypothetical protein